MYRWLSYWVPVLVALASMSEPGQAQAPKVHNSFWYQDDSDLGFKIKVPKDWEFVPPQPGEKSLIGKYDPPHNRYVDISPDDTLFLHCWLIKFDRRPEPERPAEPLEDEEGTVITISIERDYADIEDWIKDKMSGIGWAKIKEKDLRVKGVDATQYWFEGAGRGKDRPSIKAYAAVYRISEDVEVAMILNGPGRAKKWKAYDKAAQKLAKSFQRVELQVQDELAFVPTDGSPRAKKRAKLQEEIQRLPGWKLYETPNYLVVSNNDDEDFLEELMDRLEKIRAIYEEDYPPEKARRAVKKPKTPSAMSDEEGDEPEEPKKDEALRSISVKADPFELSRTSVVRVCKDRAQYHSYGGPGGSAGYWASYQEELVIYDDKKSGGRADTWAVLNHEAFHQYIFYFYGELAPHSWYNEGTGDFYAGYQYKNSRVRLMPFLWRTGTVKEMIRTGKYVPLEEFVRYTQGEYYGSSEHGTNIGHHYAQGWSFIYFLRTGKKKSRQWNDAWNHILDTYLDTLADTGDLDHAVDVAFEGVDWKELEEAWKNYIG